MVSSDFLKRLTAYPMVSSACERATAGLSWAKDRSACARTAAGIAESGLRRVADGAGPLLKRYEERIAELDRLACRQLLDRLETACPTVLQPADKVVEQGRSYLSDAVRPKVELVLSPVTVVANKVQSAKSAGLERYRQAVGSRQGQAGLRQFDQLLRLLSDCLDKCLPPASDEGKAAGSDSKEPARTDDAGNADAEGVEEPLADPAHSVSLAIALGRKVSLRVSDCVADSAGRAATAGHRLVDRFLGRNSACSSVSISTSASVASTAASSDTETPPPADESAAGFSVPTSFDEVARADDEAEESQLERSGSSTDF